MLKLSWFAVVLAVICLPVILLSVEADAQPTADGTTQCDGSNMLEDVVKEIRAEIKELKKLFTKNVTNFLLACEYIMARAIRFMSAGRSVVCHL